MRHLGIRRPKGNDHHHRQGEALLGPKLFLLSGTVYGYAHRDCFVCPFKLGLSWGFRTFRK